MVQDMAGKEEVPSGVLSDFAKGFFTNIAENEINKNKFMKLDNFIIIKE
jgi:hypothetical protein